MRREECEWQEKQIRRQSKIVRVGILHVVVSNLDFIENT